MLEAEVAVPVAVDVAGPAASQVLRVVEGALGWPVVAVDDTVLPPRCVLVDPPRAARHAGGPVPVVLVAGDGDDPAAAARAGRHAAVVLDGVPDAAGLHRVVAGLDRSRPAGRPAWCVVGAAAGGVGATTVALALAGLRAWRHGPTLAAVSGPSHHDAAPALDAGDLASPAAWAAAAPTVGVDDCRVVALRRPVAPADAGPVPLVVDLGPGAAAPDVLVLRPDRAGLAAVAAHPHATAVVVGRGAMALPSALGAPSGRRVALPWSARVAAAAAAGRLPADLPGAWLRCLEAVLTALEQRAAHGVRA